MIGCRALFATHYHELTRLGEDSEHVANYSVSAREMGDDIVFLHRLTHGAASRSYGVFVARLAGFPEAVLARADALLKGLEAGAQPTAQPQHHKSDQLDLFTPPPRSVEVEAVVDELRAIDVDRLSGLEALQWLVRTQRKLSRDDE